MRLLQCLVTAACCLAATLGATAERPNIVFILADDLGWADLGCYGNDYNETPNLDRLAREGMRFTQAYTAGTVCSPTRASILTGKYPARTGVTDWIPGDYRPGMEMECPPTKQFLSLEEFTLAEALKSAGYRTAHVGKWHLGAKPYLPDSQGFDVNIGGSVGGHPYHGYFAPYQMNNLTEGPKGEYLTDRLGAESCRIIQDAAAAHQPFFLNLWHYAVHAPIDAKPDKIEIYAAKGRDEMSAKYGAMLESLDESVGTVLKQLEESGVADNTIVIFTSDNGGYYGATENYPLRGYKSNLYEGGIRVPLIVRWPGRVKPGTECASPVTSPDFYPTLLECAGLPARPEQHVDGVSFLSALKGDTAFNRGPTFWHYPHYQSVARGEPGSVLRDGDYKFLYFYAGRRSELYDLAADPYEQRNLARLMPEKTEAMRAALDAKLKEMKAVIPTRNPAPKR